MSTCFGVGGFFFFFSFLKAAIHLFLKIIFSSKVYPMFSGLLSIGKYKHQ